MKITFMLKDFLVFSYSKKSCAPNFTNIVKAFTCRVCKEIFSNNYKLMTFSKALFFRTVYKILKDTHLCLYFVTEL